MEKNLFKTFQIDSKTIIYPIETEYIKTTKEHHCRYCSYEFSVNGNRFLFELHYSIFDSYSRNLNKDTKINDIFKLEKYKNHTIVPQILNLSLVDGAIVNDDVLLILGKIKYILGEYIKENPFRVFFALPVNKDDNKITQYIKTINSLSPDSFQMIYVPRSYDNHGIMIYLINKSIIKDELIKPKNINHNDILKFIIENPVDTYFGKSSRPTKILK